MNRLTIILVSVVSFILYSSCDDMNDIHQKYVDRGEKVYLGKVDSIKSFSGMNRVKLTWYITADPKIESTIIYWNMRKDSVIKTFTRTQPGVQKDSIVIENLPENTHVFNFRNVNATGASSLFSTVAGTAWGQNFRNSLKGRQASQLEYSFDHSTFSVKFSAVTQADRIVFSELRYTNLHGNENVMTIENTMSQVVLEDFPAGGDFYLRSQYSFPAGFETIFSNNLTYSAPQAITAVGENVLTLTDVQGSSFYSINQILYQRNAAGDLIEFKMNGSGKLEETKRINGIAPWTTFRIFFYQEPGRYIGIRTNNAVDMYQMVNDNLVEVKLSLGTGFGFPRFIPFRNMFYSVAATGETKRWLSNPNGTWGAPNGTTFSMEFGNYSVLSTYEFRSILGVDADGFLWAYPVAGDGSFSSKAKVGSGWNKYTQILPFGSKLLGVTPDGNFWLHDFSLDGDYWIIEN